MAELGRGWWAGCEGHITSSFGPTVILPLCGSDADGAVASATLVATVLSLRARPANTAPARGLDQGQALGDGRALASGYGLWPKRRERIRARPLIGRDGGAQIDGGQVP